MKICTGIIFGSCLVSLPSIHSLQRARQKQNEPKNSTENLFKIYFLNFYLVSVAEISDIYLSSISKSKIMMMLKEKEFKSQRYTGIRISIEMSPNRKPG